MLRSSELAQLRLSDFDWRDETFSVRRAKRGGIQHYPNQYEVGEAIIRYLQKTRSDLITASSYITSPLRLTQPASSDPRSTWIALVRWEVHAAQQTGKVRIGAHAVKAWLSLELN